VTLPNSAIQSNPSSSEPDKAEVRLKTWALVPGLTWLVVFFVLPLGIVLVVSLATRGTYGGVIWTFTLENYRHLLDSQYLHIYTRSVVLAGVTTAICLILGFPLAYYMARLPRHLQSLWVVLIMVPFWTNFLIRTYAWMFILSTEGVLNQVLLRVGIVAHPLQILYTDTAVVIGLVYGYLPFMVLPLYVALSRVDVSLIEVAWDLYASGTAVLWKVLVPLAKPGIVSGSILVFIPSLGAYVTPDLLGGAKSLMVGNLIQHEYLVVRDWPLGSAISFVLMLLVLAGIWLYWQLERTGRETELRGTR
jgi:spermidine/putrescine transport system permease protein